MQNGYPRQRGLCTNHPPRKSQHHWHVNADSWKPALTPNRAIKAAFASRQINACLSGVAITNTDKSPLQGLLAFITISLAALYFLLLAQVAIGSGDGIRLSFGFRFPSTHACLELGIRRIVCAAFVFPAR